MGQTLRDPSLDARSARHERLNGSAFDRKDLQQVRDARIQSLPGDVGEPNGNIPLESAQSAGDLSRREQVAVVADQIVSCVQQ